MNGNGLKRRLNKPIDAKTLLSDSVLKIPQCTICGIMLRNFNKSDDAYCLFAYY